MLQTILNWEWLWWLTFNYQYSRYAIMKSHMSSVITLGTLCKAHQRASLGTQSISQQIAEIASLILCSMAFSTNWWIQLQNIILTQPLPAVNLHWEAETVSSTTNRSLSLSTLANSLLCITSKRLMLLQLSQDKSPFLSTGTSGVFLHSEGKHYSSQTVWNNRGGYNLTMVHHST